MPDLQDNFVAYCRQQSRRHNEIAMEFSQLARDIENPPPGTKIELYPDGTINFITTIEEAE